MTVNKAHGTTCDATMTLADDLLYRELGYEAMSRGRVENRIYISRTTMVELELRLEDGPHTPPAPGDDPLDILAAGLEQRRNKLLALDQIAPVPFEAWSTADLIAERDRVRAVLNEAPADRSADLTALRESRRAVKEQIRAQQARVDQLEHRQRPRKERKLPDVDLMTSRHNLSHYERQQERLQLAIASLDSGQHRRDSHLAAHSADRIELDTIDRVLGDRLRQQTNRVVQDPPSYITKTLGPRPTDPTTDRTWIRAVVDIEKYRFDHSITDQRTTIGPEPSDPAMLNTWSRLHWTIDETHRSLTPSVLGSDRTPTPTPPNRPELDISL